MRIKILQYAEENSLLCKYDEGIIIVRSIIDLMRFFAPLGGNRIES